MDIETDETKLAALMGGVEDAIVVINGSADVVFWNPAAEQIFGYPKHEALGENLGALIVPEHQRENHNKGLERFRNNGDISSANRRIELMALRKSGEEFPAEMSLSRLSLHGSWHAVGLIQDLSNGRQALDRIRESEEFHLTVLSRISDSVVITDGAGEFTWVCPNIESIFGWASHEVWEMGNVEKLLGPPLFDSLELEARVEIPNIERDVVDKAGEVHSLLVNVKRVDIRSGTTLYTCHDVTELKQAEKKSKQVAHQNEMLLNSLPHPALLINKDRVILAANRIAQDTGAVLGGICWKDFGHCTYLSEEHRAELDKCSELAGSGIHCKFCQADESLDANIPVSNPELHAYGRIWDIRWVPLEDEVFLHYAIDITDQKKLEQELITSKKHVSGILGSISDAFASFDNQWRYTFVNENAERILQKTREELIGNSIWEVFPEAVDSPAYAHFHRAKEQQVSLCYETYFEPLETWFELRLYPYSDGLTAYFTDITEKKRALDLRAALNEINDEINSVLDFDSVLPTIAPKAAKALGCSAASILLVENGQWFTRAVFGLPEEKVGYQLSDDERNAIEYVISESDPFVDSDINSKSYPGAELAVERGIRSGVVVPLKIRGKLSGALTFLDHSKPRVFSEIEVDFAKKLGLSLSLAYESAGLLADERKIADTLQEAMLVLPQRLDGIKFGHLYRSATDGAKVGGDFYDLFELEGNRLGIVMGDISGKGLGAAALASLVKHTIKAYAYEGHSPSKIISRTNKALFEASPTTQFATVFLGILDKLSGNLVYCSAGHPAPIYKRAQTADVLLTRTSPIIGAFANLEYLEEETRLEIGGTLLLYTDGLIEARNDSDFFYESGLVSTLTNLNHLSTQELPSAIYNEVLDFTKGNLSDDVALLAIELGAE